MPSLKDIRKRIASVKNTQKITRAMKLVAAAKLRRAQQAMVELRPYAAKHRELLLTLARQLAEQGEELSHPLMQAHAHVQRVGVIAVSSDRGMCGSFNAGINRILKPYIEQRLGGGDGPSVDEVVLYPIGRRIGLFSRKSGRAVGESFGEIIALAAAPDGVRRVTDAVVSAFVAGELDEVVILSNRFKSAIAQVPTLTPLLPIVPEADDGAADEAGEPLYEPGRKELLGYVVPRYVEVQVRQAILESIAGEHAARMNAMNAATDNAADMISRLTLEMNRARQAAITKELMEIIGGAEAM